MLTAVTGINWGDEGKGRVVDLLSEHADYVVRYAAVRYPAPGGRLCAWQRNGH